MWTGLGVIFIIIMLAIPIFKWVGLFIFGGAASMSERRHTQQRIEAANEEKKKQEQLNKIQTMSPDFRRCHIAESPDTVVVGEKIEMKREWKDGRGWVYPYTVEKNKYYFQNSIRPFRRRIDKTPENGYTDSLYEYIEKIDFLDDHDKKEWEWNNRSSWGSAGYDMVRKYQCRNYCEAISMLVHRYICVESNSEFKSEFIQLLIRNRDLTLKFIKECHAVNKWREQYNQVCDCKNYLRDFMIENEIETRLTEQAGHEIKIPEDIRPYRENTPSEAALRHVKHELSKQERVGKAEESEYKAQGWWGGVGIMTLICAVLILIFFFGVEHGTDQSSLMVWLIIISGLVWMVVAFPAIGHQGDADKVKKAEQDDEYYMNPFPDSANREGKEYVKGLVEKYLAHPLPYKYYTNEE